MKKVKLGEVTINIDNRRKPLNNLQRSEKSFSKKYPYCGANNIIDYIDEYIFDENEEILCIAEDGGNWGKDEECTYVMNEKCWVNNHAHVLKMKTGVDINYIKLTLDYLDLTSYITGSTRGKLTKSSLDKIEINLPNYRTQISISKKIFDIQKLITKKETQIQKYNELVKSRFNEMFGDDSKFEKVLLGCVCDVRDGTHDSPKYVEKGYPLITSRNITGGVIDFSNTNHITQVDFNKINQRSKVDYGDILLPMIGTVGNPVVVETHKKFVIKNVALIKFYDRSKVENVYIKNVLTSFYFDKQVLQKIRGGTQKFIALKDIRELQIPLPPLSLQNEFADFVAQVDKSQLAIQKSLEELETLKKSLMQEYFG